MSSPLAPSFLSATKAGLQDSLDWVRRRPVDALLLVLLIGTLLYFYVFHRVYVLGTQSAMFWATKAWNEENDLEYGGFVFPAALVMAWYHRKQLWEAPKSSSFLGLGIALAGALLYVVAVRTLQPRLALISLPFLTYGGVRFLWGKATARIILFPSLFLLFMVPLSFLVSRTVGLQTLAATVAAKLSGLLGIGVVADGTQLRALDGSFQFEVAGGCSGIRSLTAMTMLAALYVHFFEKILWKKAVIFAGSLVFALVGNLVRIFSVVLFARFISVPIAAGLYHDYSGFVFFPIAVFCMLSFANVLNRDYRHWLTPQPVDGEAAATSVTDEAPSSAPKTKSPTAISYDY